MGAETVGTLVVVTALVAVLAVYVFLIGLGLQRLSFTLGTIVVGLRAIRQQTEPVGEVLAGIVAEAEGIESDLAGVVVAVGGDGPAPPRHEARSQPVVEVDEDAEEPDDEPDEEYDEHEDYEEVVLPSASVRYDEGLIDELRTRARAHIGAR